jgi:AraC-like DNA-binding protein
MILVANVKADARQARVINMQHFYRRALVAFVLLLLADALIACFCIYQSYPSLSLMPPETGAARWHVAAITDASNGGASTVRIRDAKQQSLRFDFRVSGAIPHPWAWAALLIDGAGGKPGSVDLSKYSTVSFLAKCQPANSLILNMITVDQTVTKQGAKPTWLPVMTYFSCDEKGMPVSLDLTRLTIPGWWYEVEHVDIARRSYKLDHVTKLEFGASQFSPRESDSHVEISDLTLHGRDERYLVALATVLVIGGCAFGIWFFRAQSRALLAKVDSRLKKDLSFVAYRQLTVEPFEDKEKAAILRFIASHYADAGLDLDGVAAGTGANRNKINEVLKTELGMTFISYLKKLRLTEAARLLTDKAGATVAEIARSVGYANSSHFNKIFKEEYGCSPRQFRNLAARSETPAEHDPAGR